VGGVGCGVGGVGCVGGGGLVVRWAWVGVLWVGVVWGADGLVCGVGAGLFGVWGMLVWGLCVVDRGGWGVGGVGGGGRWLGLVGVGIRR